MNETYLELPAENSRSKLAKLFLVSKFFKTSNDLSLCNQLKQLLFDEFNCDSELHFYSKIITLLKDNISDTSATNLYNKSLQLADKIRFASSELHNAQSNTSYLLHVSDSCMCKIASYLSQKDVISLSQVSTDLLIATNQKLFVESCSDRMSFNIDEKFTVRMRTMKSIPYILSMPSSIHIDCCLKKSVSESFKLLHHWFESIFGKVNDLELEVSEYEPNLFLDKIPMNILFEKKGTSYKMLDLSIESQFDYSNRCRKIASGFDKNIFFINYQTYLKQECRNDVENIRQIDALELKGFVSDINDILKALHYNYRKLCIIASEYISNLNNFKIDSEIEALSIFHSKLEHLKLCTTTSSIPYLRVSKSLCKSKKSCIEKLSKQDNLQILELIATDQHFVFHALSVIKVLHEFGYARNIVELLLEAHQIIHDNAGDGREINYIGCDIVKHFKLNQFTKLKTIKLMSKADITASHIDGTALTLGFLECLSKNYSNDVIPTLKKVIIDLNCSYSQRTYNNCCAIEFETIYMKGNFSSQHVKKALQSLTSQAILHHGSTRIKTLFLKLEYQIKR